MNKKMIIYTLGKILEIEAALLLIPFGVGLIYGESQGLAFLEVATLCLLVGFLISHKTPENKNIYAKDGFVIVALAWIVISLFGALPFVINGDIPSYVDAVFETISGFTTTGSSILPNIEALSHASLFWRSFAHWIGGMGFLVFVLAFLPLANGRSVHIMKAEMPGPVVGKLVSKVKVTSQILYIIYGVITLAECVLLMFGGMPLFDALITSFGTAGTGGFAVKNASIAAYDSAYIDYVITIFMIIFGVNFNLYFLIVVGKIKDALKSEELHWYFGIIASFTLVITLNIMHLYNGSFMTAFRYAFFQVGSIMTTTGFVTANFETWPMLSQILLVALIFCGAMAGSTGGGMKVSRIVMAIKHGKAELAKMIHPRSVQVVKFENQPVDDSVIHTLASYFILYALVFVLSMLVLSLSNLDFTSIFTAVATCLNNVGPGLGVVGPVNNFATLTDYSKIILCFDMLAGRLEIFPMVIIFSKSLWSN